MSCTAETAPSAKSVNCRRSLGSASTLLRLGIGFSLILGTGCDRVEQAPAKYDDKLVVFAAASLRDVFTTMGDRFRSTHPGVELRFNFAGTQKLRTQIEHGAAVDVFASADQRHMNELVRASHVLKPVVFARNEPVMVLANEAAQRIREFSQLASTDSIVIGTPDVPIGRYTLQILDRASTTLGADFRSRVEARVVSRELSVRQVLTKVRLGEAEAGLVYRTDALAAQAFTDAQAQVSVVTIPSEINVIAEYPIAVASRTAQPELARAWVEFVLSGAGQEVLRKAGFSDAGQEVLRKGGFSSSSLLGSDSRSQEVSQNGSSGSLRSTEGGAAP